MSSPQNPATEKNNAHLRSLFPANSPAEVANINKDQTLPKRWQRETEKEKNTRPARKVNTWKLNERAGALTPIPPASTPAQIAQHVADPVYIQEKLPANLEALLARVDENNKTQNDSRKELEHAMERSKKEAEKDLELITATNVDFMKRQIETRTQLETIKKRQESVDNNISNLSTTITKISNGMNNFETNQNALTAMIMKMGKTLTNLTTQMNNMER